MVRFDATAKENDNAVNNQLDRVATPHPHKKVRHGAAAAAAAAAASTSSGAESGSGYSEDAGLMVEVSLDNEHNETITMMTTTTPGAPHDPDATTPAEADDDDDDDAVAAAALLEEEQKEESWRALVATIEQDSNSSSYKNLHAFQQALQLQAEARERLQSAYQQGMDSMNMLVDGALADMYGNEQDEEQPSGATTSAASACFLAQQAERQQVESQLVQQMVGNHKRRQRLVEMIERNKTQFEATHTTLMAAVLNNNAAASSAGEGNGGALNGDITTDDETTPTRTNRGTDKRSSDSDNHDDDDNVVVEEPDWEDLLQFEPSSDDMQLFLTARSMMHHADLRFQQALTATDQSFKECLLQLESSVGEAYELLCNDLDEQERDIRSHLSSNVQRRQAFEANVQEQAMQSQSFFARLLSSVKNYSSTTST